VPSHALAACTGHTIPGCFTPELIIALPNRLYDCDTLSPIAEHQFSTVVRRNQSLMYLILPRIGLAIHEGDFCNTAAYLEVHRLSFFHISGILCDPGAMYEV
jgi:hypothetical protein